jgi:hypothetical protein
MRYIVSPAAFDALLARLSRPGEYCPRVARVLSTPAPWEAGDTNKYPSSTQQVR